MISYGDSFKSFCIDYDRILTFMIFMEFYIVESISCSTQSRVLFCLQFLTFS